MLLRKGTKNSIGLTVNRKIPLSNLLTSSLHNKNSV